MSKFFSLFGLKFDSITMNQCIEKISQLIKDGKKNGENYYVATINLDFLSKAIGLNRQKIKNKKLFNCLKNSVIKIADGMPIVWWSKLLKKSLPERITGADLVPELCKKANSNNWKVYFLGSSDNVLNQLTIQLKNTYKNIRIVGHASPDFRIINNQLMSNEYFDKKILKDIKKSNPDLMFLSFGCPKQEFIYEYIKNKCNVPVTIGVGGTPNFMCHQVSRAPRFVQNIGFEWLYRLSQEPTRLFSRYINNGVFFIWHSIKLINITKN